LDYLSSILDFKMALLGCALAFVAGISVHAAIAQPTQATPAQTQSVTVERLPSVIVQKDPIDYAPSVLGLLTVLIAIVGSIVSYRAFTHQRDAVRLTQRADVLLDGIGISTHPQALGPLSEIAVVFKNYGTTRASAVRLDVWLNFADIQGTPEQDGPIVVIGPGETQRKRFEALHLSMDQKTADGIVSGEIPLTLIGSATYCDVFGKRHRTLCEGRYRAVEGVFEITSMQAD
jgi:hypothetical protein